MADLYTTAQTTSKERYANGQSIRLKSSRDGALYTMSYKLNMAIEGRVFHTSVGALTTPTTFRVGIQTLQPELVIDVPSGTSIIPVEIAVHLETLAGTLTEMVAMTGTALRGAGTSTAGSAASTRTDRVVSSACSVYYTYSGNATAISGAVEFWRYGFPWVTATAEGNAFMKFTYSMDEHTPQVVVGPGSISLCVGATGTAPTGYITASWIEVPSASV